MKRRKYMALLLALILLLGCTGCGTARQKEDPVTVTLWHVYGAQTDSPLNDLINQFNQTVGAEQNICVKVTSVSNTNTIHEGVLAAAFGDPGAPELPDMFVSYPKTVLAMPDESVLVDYSDYFNEEEISEFLPSFIAEGTVNDRLVVLPVAKSTEIMFINKTAFDRFSAATGAKLSDLETWEGLFNLADDYVAWTDAQTPDIPDDGKVFFVHDYHFNYFQVGVESLGENFFDGDGLAFSPAFDTVWEPYARATLAGGVWLQSGYATEPLRTGDSIVSVASSASVLYYSDTVTYADNTSERVEIMAMPCPGFQDGEKLVMQRGAGICTVKSTPAREQACVTFLKWLTDVQRNVEFVTRLGYMPVKQESFDTYLPTAIENLENPMYASLYQAFLETQAGYEFYTAPKLDSYLELETRFEENVRYALKYGIAKYKAAGPDAIEDQIWATLDYFKEHY
ncbi:multiple sugar transport system substrate-binding protein [Oscillibacter sp. PC13]|uniref:extracellular solute-binding protein n=1 Tax=Oscillibacter sp. PC13 TaxID=1855299 RepID=UPI0008EA4E61|nr:extracellular solute-binding protein [Oscillibacter sp. PC13]SFQ15558.1 multiple sugar transport system substrate-binding protein [Oscillibacter sp. PC13]